MNEIQTPNGEEITLPESAQVAIGFFGSQYWREFHEKHKGTSTPEAWLCLAGSMCAVQLANGLRNSDAEQELLNAKVAECEPAAFMIVEQSKRIAALECGIRAMVGIYEGEHDDAPRYRPAWLKSLLEGENMQICKSDLHTESSSPEALLAQGHRLLVSARKDRMTEETRAESFRAQRDALAVKIDAVRDACEAIADGAPDAAPQDKFANRILVTLDCGL